LLGEVAGNQHALWEKLLPRPQKWSKH